MQNDAIFQGFNTDYRSTSRLRKHAPPSLQINLIHSNSSNPNIFETPHDNVQVPIPLLTPLIEAPPPLLAESMKDRENNHNNEEMKKPTVASTDLFSLFKSNCVVVERKQ